MAVDYEKMIADLVRPLIINPDDLAVKQLSDDGQTITISIFVHEDDLGRVIGKNGRIANAIRTIAYASASRDHKKISINIESF
ncbi:MAG: KH domain-containing protein [Acholeplasmatales bacterium]|nr:MAG: KH domain-containing protein [Acholeplasmatales bacterium]